MPQKTVSMPCLISENSRNSDSSFLLWHRRLGHANHRAVKQILDLCNVPHHNKAETDFCDACCLGKTHKSYAPPSEIVHHKPFELIFLDLWGLAPFTSSCSYFYYITFVDTSIRFTWIYFLKKKLDAFAAFKQFHTLISTQFQAQLKVVQTNSGGEFKVFTTYLNERGIAHRFTCPHTSHQNGSVERKHRQIVDMRLTLLAQSQLPYSYWDHSFTSTVHLINHLPTSTLPSFSSPFHALYGKVASYTDIKVFGCSCFPLLRPYNKHKFQFRSEEFVYLGLSPLHKGHKCMSSSGRIYISKDVIFNELKFPYQSLFQSQYQQPNHFSYLSINHTTCFTLP